MSELSGGGNITKRRMYDILEGSEILGFLRILETPKEFLRFHDSKISMISRWFVGQGQRRRNE